MKKKFFSAVILLILVSSTFPACNKLSQEKCLGDFRRTYEISSAAPVLGISAVTVSETYRFLADGTGLFYEGFLDKKEILFYFSYTLDKNYEATLTVTQTNSEKTRNVGDQITLRFELEEKEAVLYDEYISYNKVTA